MQASDRIVLNHLDRMTDSTGLLQHAIYSVPRRESGYTTDDNARALRLCVRLWSRRPEDSMLSRIMGYLSFLEHARSTGGRFRNVLSYQRHWLDEEGTEDCQGQAIRALAEVLGSCLPEGCRQLARELIERALPALSDLQSIRAQAYVILGWGHISKSGVKDLLSLAAIARRGAQRLVERYRRSARPGWQWFEPSLTYANAVLPHALFVAARQWPGNKFSEVAEASFDFLDQETTVQGLYWPVGNDGWYPQGEDKAPYDQQPVEAVTMVDAALAGLDLLGEEKCLSVFGRAHGWFHGQNSLGQPLVDVGSGACCDGLQPSRVNLNQGAESTLAYLWTEVHVCDLQDLLQEDRIPAWASAWPT
jgi:hypothetical protein